MITEALQQYLQGCLKSFDTISSERKDLLARVAVYIQDKVNNSMPVNLIFICTHNSRRSHISQLWAQAASYYFAIPNVKCYSAGTEATAFNPRAVKAIRKAGFKIDKPDETGNPVYTVEISSGHKPLQAFSKVIEDSSNPQTDFAAIMTCSSANEACPVVHGADIRFPVMYEDPKVADDTPLEEQRYNERVKQIGTEMLYLFSKVNTGVN
jgi:protein-tyrosine-phosphatase